VSYVVRPLPNVTEELARADRQTQDTFQHILSVIALNPYPNPQFPLISEEVIEGVLVYSYLDGRFPYIIDFVVHPEDDREFGVIDVIGLTRARNR
jgi:hypothetical protein